MHDSLTAARVIGAVRESVSKYTELDDDGSGHRQGYGMDIINCSFGYGLFPIGLQRAFNYAYENGVSVVCSRGNQDSSENETTLNYPSTFEPNWVTSVGSHDGGDQSSGLLPSRSGFSYFGKGMDLLAPGSNLLVYSTTLTKGTWAYFPGTSAAAPHLTGAIALLKSEFVKHPTHCVPYSIIPETEDYENMIKASAKDLNYAPNDTNDLYRTHIDYDNVTGWGMLKIGKIFDMLADGYVLKHYTITNWQKSEFLDSLDIVINNEGERNDCPLGAFFARKKTITGSITLDNNWIRDANHKLYVWGTSGHSRKTHKGGFSAGNPLYLTAFTEVTNGQGGNGIVPGIYLDSGLTVTAKTYSYQLSDKITHQNPIGEFPLDANIELYISVFGLPSVTSVGEDFSSNSSKYIYPNPAIDYIEIKPSEGLQPADGSDIQIFDMLGTVVATIHPMTGSNRLNIENLSPGMYFIKIGSKVEKFLKM